MRCIWWRPGVSNPSRHDRCQRTPQPSAAPDVEFVAQHPQVYCWCLDVQSRTFLTSRFSRTCRLGYSTRRYHYSYHSSEWRGVEPPSALHWLDLRRILPVCLSLADATKLDLLECSLLTRFERAYPQDSRESTPWNITLSYTNKTWLHCVKVVHISLRYHSSGRVKVRCPN